MKTETILFDLPLAHRDDPMTSYVAADKIIESGELSMQEQEVYEAGLKYQRRSFSSSLLKSKQSITKMDRPNIQPVVAAKLLSLLEQADEPLTAAVIAQKLNLAGERETQRRHVRAIVEYLRQHDSMIIATLSAGYWLTKDGAMYKEYLEGRQIDVKRILGETGRQKKTVFFKGQGILFTG